MRLAPLLATVIGFFLTTAPILAHAEGAFGIEELIERSDLIFRGTVTGIQYKTALPGPHGEPSAPYSFITLSVEEVYKGRVEGGSFTLQLMGGVIDSSKYAIFKQAPAFDVGERSILFVVGNTISICPLVNCRGGRMRVVGEKVYSDFGQEVRLDSRGSLSGGKVLELEEVRFQFIGGKKLERMTVKPASHAVEGVTLDEVRAVSPTLSYSVFAKAGLPALAAVSPGGHPPEEGQAAHLEAFSAFLITEIHKRYSPDKLAALPAAISADISAPLINRFGRLMKGPADPSAPKLAPIQTPDGMGGKDVH